MYPQFPNYAALISFGVPLLILIWIGVQVARSVRKTGLFAIEVAAASALLGTLGLVPAFAKGNCTQSVVGFTLALLGLVPSIVSMRRRSNRNGRNITVFIVALYLSIAWATLISGCIQDRKHEKEMLDSSSLQQQYMRAEQKSTASATSC